MKIMRNERKLDFCTLLAKSSMYISCNIFTPILDEYLISFFQKFHLQN